MGQLLTLGDPDGSDSPNYRSLGISDEHVPALLDLLLDERIAWSAWTEGEDETPFWAHVHAWRALGELGAEAAAEPLLRRLALDHESDFANEDIPQTLGMIGPAALDAVREALPRAAAEPQPWTAVALSEALKQIATRHPQARGEAVAAMTAQLQAWRDQDLYLNTFLISNLLDLRAVEAGPAMEAALAGRRVDTTVTGDWEDVQVALGLLTERITPAPRYVNVLDDPWLMPARASTGSAKSRVRPAAPPAPLHPAAKASKLRKKQKQASRRRRK